MTYLKVFLTGGLLCVIGEALILKTKLTPARILVLYITAGVILSAAGLYGHLLAQGAISAVQEKGLLGAFTGGMQAAAGGIAAAVFFGFLTAVCFKPRPKDT